MRCSTVISYCLNDSFLELYENKMFFSGGMLDKNDKTHGKIKWNDFKTVYTGIKNSHQWNFATDLNEDCVFFQWTENDNIFFFTQKCHTPAHYICQKLKGKIKNYSKNQRYIHFSSTLVGRRMHLLWFKYLQSFAVLKYFAINKDWHLFAVFVKQSKLIQLFLISNTFENTFS